MFPGNTVDVTTVAKVKQDLKGWRLNRCVFVGDSGMVSAHNLCTLARGGGRYIVPVHPGGEVDREVVSRRGRYRVVVENLRVKEVVVGDGERRRRYGVCFNPREAERQRNHRTSVLTELEAQLASLREGSAGGHGSMRIANWTSCGKSIGASMDDGSASGEFRAVGRDGRFPLADANLNRGRNCT